MKIAVPESRTRNIYFKLGPIYLNMSSLETGLSLNIHVYRIPMVVTDFFCITLKNSIKLLVIRFLVWNSNIVSTIRKIIKVYNLAVNSINDKVQLPINLQMTQAGSLIV